MTNLQKAILISHSTAKGMVEGVPIDEFNKINRETLINKICENVDSFIK